MNPEQPAAADKTIVTRSFFNNAFVRFGAGSFILAPIRKFRYWNAAAWTLIVVGTAGWAILLWFLRDA